jgi:hypothetical protein
MSFRSTTSLRRIAMISFPNRRQAIQSPQRTPSAPSTILFHQQREPRVVPAIALGKFGRSTVVNYASVFELPPIYRGQPLSTAEIEAILVSFFFFFVCF